MLKGLVPVLLTPMTRNGDLDETGLRSLLKYLYSNEIGGLWALGSAGEEINIGFEQKLQFASLLAQHKDEKIPVIIGTGCISLYDNFKFIESPDISNLDGIHILPYDLKMGVSRTINFYETLADRSPLPIWMYHNPKRARSFELETIKHLSQHPNIAGIKIGGYDLGLITKCFMLKSKSFDVIGAGSGQLFQCLCLGAEAHTTSEGSVLPKLFQKIFSLFAEGKTDQALLAQQNWINLNSKMPRTDNGEHAAEEKYMLKLLGICDDHVNPNYRSLTEHEKSKVEELFPLMQDL